MDKGTKRTIKVGTWIGFKSDVEQSAEVVEIKTVEGFTGKRTVYLVKAPASGFEGEYLRKMAFAEIDAEDIF